MQVKGTSPIATGKFIRETFGAQGHLRWLNAMTPQTQLVMGQPLLASAWYPARTAFFEPMEAACRLFYNGEAIGAWEIGHFSALDSLRGVYRAFARLASVSFMIGKTANIFASYYQPGKMEVMERTDNRIVLRMLDVDEHHPLFDDRIRGWLAGALEVCGQKGHTVELGMSLSRGGSFSEFIITY